MYIFQQMFSQSTTSIPIALCLAHEQTEEKCPSSAHYKPDFSIQTLKACYVAKTAIIHSS